MTIGELIRKTENDFISGETQISRYVSYSLNETINKIDAYLYSKFPSGDTDSLGRDKPFFNIVTALVNVWYRATDIDRKDIKIRATKTKDWIDSFLANIHIKQWMRKTSFGQFLNEWGRTLAKYGSAVVKFVKKDGELQIIIVPWQKIIVDSVDGEGNPKIEIMELTEAQLQQRVKTHGYDAEQVKGLIDAKNTRETIDKRKKDNKSEYIKLYEVHGLLPKSFLTGDDDDKNTYVQQMQIVSFQGKRVNGKIEFKDFILFKGEESKDPYTLTHLIKEDGRTLAIGAVEHSFEAQWMVNHTQKAIKDSLDLASRMIFQTADETFIGRNVLNNLETGQILIHKPNLPLTQINNNAYNTTFLQNYSTQWRELGREINSVSEAMLGVTPKSGTAWRQTEAVLSESHSLFEQMIENKGLQLEQMFREWIIPHIKTKMDNVDEISDTLDQYSIERIDSLYVKNLSNKIVIQDVVNKFINREEINPEEEQMLLEQSKKDIKERLSISGNQRFFKPDDIPGNTWKKQLKDLEWEMEIDITGESSNALEEMTTLNTALKAVLQPEFEENKRAQMIVGKILELSGTLSPVEYNSFPSNTPQQIPEQRSVDLLAK